MVYIAFRILGETEHVLMQFVAVAFVEHLFFDTYPHIKNEVDFLTFPVLMIGGERIVVSFFVKFERAFAFLGDGDFEIESR